MAMRMLERDEEPQRWFQRTDGVIFPMTDAYHCKRLLEEGWREVAGPVPVAVKAPGPDARDEEIARLKALLAEKEAGHVVQTNDVESGGRGQGLNRRPGQR